MSFQEVKAKCLKDGLLFEDPDFPACSRSIYWSKPVAPHVEWKRPSEICSEPKFIVEGATRFDLDQGLLGDCWFIAAVATLATRQNLLERVVPPDQHFSEDYAGVFQFFFWHYGEWKEVIIDDKLPCKYGKFLMFSKNAEQPNEFWAALLEKAYAKLNGSYENLIGGKIQDALVDLTAGASEVLCLKDKANLPTKLFKYMVQINKMNSLMGCSIPSPSGCVKRLHTGLYLGHAYSITGLTEVNVDGSKVRMIRVRNPQGKNEWNGAWSDGSSEWRNLDEKTKKKNDVVCEADGEFWMSFEDWRRNFTELQICHLTPQSRIIDKQKRQWRMEGRHGAWVKGVSAGGCGNPPHRDLYWTNPQYHVTLTEASDAGRECMLVVSLMRENKKNALIGFDIFRVKDNYSPCTGGQTYPPNALRLEYRMDSNTYTIYREVCQHYELTRGQYCIIPVTFHPELDARFYLRVVTEKNVQMDELDDETGPVMCRNVSRVIRAVCRTPSADPEMERKVWDMFQKHSGGDNSIDSSELRKLLNEVFYGDELTFSAEESRTLLLMWDTSRSGVLEYSEVCRMIADLKKWQTQFKSIDEDQTGNISFHQLKDAFSRIDLQISKNVWKSLRLRYGNKNDEITFQDFIMCAAKIHILCDTFGKRVETGGNSITLSRETFVSEALRH